MATRTISTKLAITGEEEYRAKIKNVNAELALHKSELEKVKAQYADSANSLEALGAKQSALKGQMEALNKKYNAQAEMLGKAQQAQKEYAYQVEEIGGKLERARARLEELQQSSGDTSAAEAKLTAEIEKHSAALASAEANMQKAANSSAFYQKQLNATERDQYKLTAELGRTEQYLEEAKASADGCATSIDRFGKEVKGAGESSEKFAGGTQQAKEGIDQLAAALAAAGIAKSVKEIADALMECVDTFAAFEAQMSTVQAISGASGEDLAALADKAKYMGATTAFTATQAAQALEYMAMAGWKPKEMLDGLEGVMNLASASGENLGATSDIVTDALTAFGLAASDSGRFADVLAAASSNANTNVAMMGETFKYAAPVAGALGYSVEDTALAIGLMANAGIKGSQAGSSLRSVLTNLSKPSQEVADYMEGLGISLTDSSGQVRTLAGLLDVLRVQFADLTEAQKAEYAAGIAGKEAMSGLLAIVNASEADYQKLKRSIDSCSGSAKEMADIKLDNFAGQMTLLESASDGLKTAIGEALTPALRELAEAGTDAISWATEFVGENEWLVQAITGAIGAVGLLAAGLTTYTVAATAAKAVQDALNLSIGLCPLVAVTAAVGALVGVVGSWLLTMGDADESTQEFTGSLRETKAAYDELTASMAKEQASTDSVAAALKKLLAAEAQSASQKESIKQMVDQLNEAVPGLALAYDETTGSINMTTEALDAQLARAAAQEEYQAQVDRLTQLYVEQEEIAARLEEAQEQLTEAEEESAGAANLAASSYAAASGAHLEQNTAAGRLRGTIEALTAAEAENAAQIAALEGETAAYAQQQAEAALATETMAATVDGLIVEMEALQQSYQESYDAAWKSIDGQLGMFNELDGTAKTSIDSLIETLEGQVKYMDDYAANIQRAMELGVDEGLIRKLSDGSQESAQILDAIVKGGEEDIQTLNQQLARVQEGKDRFSNTVAQMETEFDKKMGEITKANTDMVEALDAYEEAQKAGANTIQGYIDGINSMRDDLDTAYRNLARAGNGAWMEEMDENSPSKVFYAHGENTVLGAIGGVEARKAELSAAYENLAKVALEGYADGVYKNLDEVEQALATLETALKSVDSFYSTKSDVSSLQYQLWERTDGKWASDTAKYAKKLEMLTSQQEDQKTVVEAAEAAYEAVVAQYGAASEESYNLQKTLLEEKLAYQDLLDTIQQVNNAKSEAFAAQEAARWSSGGYGGYLPGYEDAAQAALLGMATHLPSVVEAPATSAPIDRQLELVAASINAISDAAGIAHTTPSSINLMTPDGKVMASWLLDPLAGYADANGTPIINPS